MDIINFRPTRCIALDSEFNCAFNDMQPQFVNKEDTLPETQADIRYLAEKQITYEMSFN